MNHAQRGNARDNIAFPVPVRGYLAGIVRPDHHVRPAKNRHAGKTERRIAVSLQKGRLSLLFDWVRPSSLSFRLLLSCLPPLTTASQILLAGIQHHRANVLKRHSAACSRNVAILCLVTTAILPAGFGVFAHGALHAFGGSLADSVFRVNACTSFRNPRRKCTGPGRDAGPSNRGTGNRLCRSGGRRRSRQ